MLNLDAVGNFYVRIKECPAFVSVEGKIVYIREVSTEGIQFSFVDNCRPEKEVYALPPEGNDNGWYNITDLIYAANTVILPKYSRCVWESETAMNYRNFITDSMFVVEETDAIGKLCLLGNVKGKTINLLKQVYFVVAVDDNSYMLVYSGFCQPLADWQKPVIQQRVLRIIGTARKLFLAEPIVKACNEAYHEDIEHAEKFITKLREETISSGSESMVGRSSDYSGVHHLKFGG